VRRDGRRNGRVRGEGEDEGKDEGGIEGRTRLKVEVGRLIVVKRGRKGEASEA
jgi:hypothetical protein